MGKSIRFEVNGRTATIEGDDQRRLLWVLRGELGLTGAKYGCGEGICGACTVLVDGAAARSCMLPMAGVAGKRVVTIEGLAAGEKLHPLQEAFLEEGGFQCGYCTPGMILAAQALLAEKPAASRREIVDGLEANLCRCGAHPRIVAAVERVAGRKGGAS
jgi:aerobic-type carbon monoxide dehydrogenase small subunit (CoxS/CutS family)